MSAAAAEGKRRGERDEEERRAAGRGIEAEMRHNPFEGVYHVRRA